MAYVDCFHYVNVLCTRVYLLESTIKAFPSIYADVEREEGECVHNTTEKRTTKKIWNPYKMG